MITWIVQYECQHPLSSRRQAGRLTIPVRETDAINAVIAARHLIHGCRECQLEWVKQENDIIGDC